MSDIHTFPNSQMGATQNTQSMTVTIECFGAIERLLPTNLSLQFESKISIAHVLDSVEKIYPESGKMLERCACAMGEDIIPRQTQLTSDSIIVLLSPVAGG